MEGNLRFKIDWGSLIVGRKFTVFALFYLVFEGNFQEQAPGGLIFGGAYFPNFMVFIYFKTIKWILKLLNNMFGEQDCMCYITAFKYSS